MSFIYIQSEPELWTVGHYDPKGTFIPESDHSTPGEAGGRVGFLNGGNYGSKAVVNRYGAFYSEITDEIKRDLEDFETAVIEVCGDLMPSDVWLLSAHINQYLSSTFAAIVLRKAINMKRGGED